MLLIIRPWKNSIHQKHKHRKETWTITKGKDQLLINDKISDITTDDSISINLEDKFSVKALEELYIIEVQIG